jgi:polar amino acid transport system substrate-binding protein/glutamate/aspartate transport system substrate-binding protein
MLEEHFPKQFSEGARTMKIRSRWSRAVMIAALLGISASGEGVAWAGAIDKIRADQTIRIAYREDAPPFSFKAADSTDPTGFTVNLCRAVAKKLGDQLGIASLKIAYVAVTAANRFDTIEKNGADLLCEATSATLSRRKQVDFSIATFADGAGVLTSDTSIQFPKGLEGRKVGVVAGTTTEQSLRTALSTAKITAEVIPAKTHDEGLAMLDDGKIVAYFADRAILMNLVSRSKAPDKLSLGEDYLSIEPYALALSRGDSEFRLAVDTALSQIYRSGEIANIFTQTFGSKVKTNDTAKVLYFLSALPD